LRELTRDNLIQLAADSGCSGEISRRLNDIEQEISALRESSRKARHDARSIACTALAEARLLCTALLSERTQLEDRAHVREKLKVLTKRIFARIGFHPLLPHMNFEYEQGPRVVASY
jgi:hypothetical protein